MYNEAALEIRDCPHDFLGVEPTPVTAQVTVLLGTYNGERFLDEQLQSIIHQSYSNWQIIVSDDGSTDRTPALLKRYQQQLGEKRLRIIEGPRRGFAANFMALADAPETQTEYFAFSDQDDIWHPDHLERAVHWMQLIDGNTPALYCGRTRLVQDSGEPFGTSPLFCRPPSFANALVQSLAGGNTMVFNRSAQRLLTHTRELPIVSHDWWLYMLVSGAQGYVHYSEKPTVDYRQHGGNLIGANSSIKDRAYRIRRMFAGHFQDWNDINLAALSQCQELLSEDNRKILHTFASTRRSGVLARLQGMISAGIYRQTTPGNLALALAAILGKI
ncbi:glycosyltransferase family 2 protein [Ectopseudomonas composti]